MNGLRARREGVSHLFESFHRQILHLSLTMDADTEISQRFEAIGSALRLSLRSPKSSKMFKGEKEAIP